MVHGHGTAGLKLQHVAQKNVCPQPPHSAACALSCLAAVTCVTRMLVWLIGLAQLFVVRPVIELAEPVAVPCLAADTGFQI